MSIIVMVASIVVGTASLVWGYSLAGLNTPAFWLAATGAIWLFALWKRIPWIASFALLGFVSAAAYGMWISLPASLMTLGAVGGLLGWDMENFARRLRLASVTDDVRRLERLHLARVAVVSALGLGIAGVTAIVRIKIPFELAVVLVLLTAIGLTRVVAWLQSRFD